MNIERSFRSCRQRTSPAERGRAPIRIPSWSSRIGSDGRASSLRLRLKVYVIDTIYEKTLETDITLRVMEAFRAENIQPPAILHRQLSDGTQSGGIDPSLMLAG